METAKMTSKGQLVIPKKIRDAVRAGPGTEFHVRIEGERIVLEIPRRKDRKVTEWPGLNPRKVKLGRKELCDPVVLNADDDRR